MRLQLHVVQPVFFMFNIFVCSCIPNTCSLVFKPSQHGSDDAVV